MMLCLSIFLCYLSFNFASANDENIALCFYDQQLKDFVFTVNIANIKQNVSCTNNCACNGTTFGYSNCQSCCCQRRVNMNYAIDNHILGDCFHNDQSKDLFFTTSATGIQQIVSCSDHCNCNRTNPDYSTALFNCPPCCCQKRETSGETKHDCKGLKATVSILAVLFPLFIAFMYYFVYRRNKKQSNLKIQHLKTELAGKERDQRELEENLAHTEQELEQIRNNLRQQHDHPDHNGG